MTVGELLVQFLGTVSFDVCHYHDVSDFSVDHADRYFTEYVPDQGVGIGSVLSSVLAFLKQHFASQRVLQGQVTKAVSVTVADNCFIVGPAKSVASLLVRSFKVDQGQRGALWHESGVLRFVPDSYKNGTYDMGTARGRGNICARIKAAFVQCVRQVSADFQLHPELQSILTPTPVRLRGTKFVGVFYWKPKVPATQSVGCISQRGAGGDTTAIVHYRDESVQDGFVY